MKIIQNGFFLLSLQQDGRALVYTVPGGRAYRLELPVFSLDGLRVPAALTDAKIDSRRALHNGAVETVLLGTLGASHATLKIVFRHAGQSPVLRMRFVLAGNDTRRLTKPSGRDELCYLRFSVENAACKELRLSDFNGLVHSFCPTETPVDDRYFADGASFMGPVFLAQREGETALLAYEHGSQAPDRFLEFRLSPEHAASLCAVKGNYYDGRRFSDEAPFESVWFEFCACSGGEDELAHHYRRFILKYLSENTESRKPYIFYNTWAFQERNKWWNGRTFSESVENGRILREIDRAHEMGVEVFVLDLGWFEKAGDWTVSRARFPDGMKAVRERLCGYGMKLGLWFDPQAAGVTSRLLRGSRNCTIRSADGSEAGPYGFRESEDCYRMCLASPYWEAFADELIRLNRELGVTYFKWDAIHQYGCSGTGHFHGAEFSPAEERSDCYAFEIGRYMSKIVDRVTEICPDTIIDFDVTEGQRFMGLGFLASGKYFLINNGPYYHDYDIPRRKDEWSNVFVWPGPARAQVCRYPLCFDKWIPSVLFLTHYLPDDPVSSQQLNLASLILGQNGVWGDLLSVSDEGVRFIRGVLDRYKRVRDDITESDPVVTGCVGGNPEIHEKLNENGRGAVVAFAGNSGRYTAVTSRRVDRNVWHTEGADVSFDAEGRAKLSFTFRAPGAHIVFFGN